MLMKPEERGASDLTTHGSEMVEEEEEERDIDGVPLLESQPIDFSRTGGGVSIPVVGTVEGRGADFDGEPMEVSLSLSRSRLLVWDRLHHTVW